MRMVHARAYVMRILAVELREALADNRAWVYEDPASKGEMDEFDIRRVRNACRQLAEKFEKHAAKVRLAGEKP